jgi:hypothetical protein
MAAIAGYIVARNSSRSRRCGRANDPGGAPSGPGFSKTLTPFRGGGRPSDRPHQPSFSRRGRARLLPTTRVGPGRKMGEIIGPRLGREWGPRPRVARLIRKGIWFFGLHTHQPVQPPTCAHWQVRKWTHFRTDHPLHLPPLRGGISPPPSGGKQKKLLTPQKSRTS